MFGVTVFASESDPKKYDPTDDHPYEPSELEEMEALIGTLSYAEYLASRSEQRAAYKTYLDGLDAEVRKNLAETNKGSFSVDKFLPGSTAELVSTSTVCNTSKENPEYQASWENYDKEGVENAVYLPANGY